MNMDAVRAWRPPTVAIVGRPNVGKSTLFNRLVGHRAAITFDTPGVTRDRREEIVDLALHKVRLVDTGGFEPGEREGMLPLMRRQAQIAIGEADAVIFLACARQGLLPADEVIVAELRRAPKPFFLAANKCDTPRLHADAMSFYALGVDEVYPISAEHDLGVADLVASVIDALAGSGAFDGEPAETEVAALAPVRGGVVDRVRVCFVGRPNVGKSTLVNQLLGRERVVTADEPGTTRDAIDVEFEFAGRPYTLVDTAGLRRKRAVDGAVEQYAVSQAVRAIERCHVAVVVLDATIGLADQDSKIAALVQDRGRACVVAINKWDAVEKDTHTARGYEIDLARHLPFLEQVPKVFISARTGQRVDRLVDTVQRTFDNFNRRVPTHAFNTWLLALQSRTQPPSHRGRRLKMHYGAQLAVRPPKFVILVNLPEAISAAYERFLMAQIRDEWDFFGSPIRLELKKKARRKKGAPRPAALPPPTGDADLDALLSDPSDPEAAALHEAMFGTDDGADGGDDADVDDEGGGEGGGEGDPC